MSNRRLIDLPPPPPCKTGWPWTEEAPHLPDLMPNGLAWPRITIVTPSFNQAEYIEETLRSVLLQGYPNLEYFVIDGGSTDGSAEIIAKYSQWIDHWESVPDDGQADAINKGLERSTGDIFQFINSDDLLTKQALQTVANAYVSSSSLPIAVIGNVLNFSGHQETLIENRTIRIAAILEGNNRPHQPGIFLRRELLAKLGGYDISYWYFFDYKLILTYFAMFPGKQVYTNTPLVMFRVHPDAKTSAAFGTMTSKAVETVRNEEERLFLELSQHPLLPKSQMLFSEYAELRHWRREISTLERSRQSGLSIMAVAFVRCLQKPRIRLRGFLGMSFRVATGNRQKSYG